MEAFECGAVVNPNGLRNQIEGAIMMGIGGALFAELRFAAGRILSSHFSEYRVLRFKNMPQIGGAGDRSCPPIELARHSQLLRSQPDRERQKLSHSKSYKGVEKSGQT